MPQGDKSSYSSKQRRQASHIEESERRRGRSRKSAERIAWATVNKQDGGAKGKRKAGGRTRSRSSTSRPKRTARSARSTGRGRSRRTARARA